MQKESKGVYKPRAGDETYGNGDQHEKKNAWKEKWESHRHKHRQYLKLGFRIRICRI